MHNPGSPRSSNEIFQHSSSSAPRAECSFSKKKHEQVTQPCVMSEKTKSELHTIIVGFARGDTFERIFHAFLSLGSLVFTKRQIWDPLANHWDCVRPMFCTTAGAKPATRTFHGRGAMRTWGRTHNALWQVTGNMGIPSELCAQEQAKHAPHAPLIQLRITILDLIDQDLWSQSYKLATDLCATSQLSIADCRLQTHASWKGAVTFFSPGRLAK